MTGDSVVLAVRVWVLAVPLHQDDLPPHALLLPPHQNATHTQVRGAEGAKELTSPCIDQIEMGEIKYSVRTVN